MSSRRCKCIANEWNIKEKHEVFLCIPECSLHYPNVQFLIEISKFPRRFLLTSIIFMATIEYRLSTKVQQDGRAEIMVRFFHGRSINQSTGTQHYGKPYYITIEKRNRIAEADLSKLWEKMPDKEKKGPHYSLEILMQQRDMFVFQCFVGCRISDLMELTGKNIIHGILQYYPHKTKDDGAEVMMASVPLHPKALALVEKYKGVDQNGRLFPFISSQKYNDAIKLIFTMTGITREVVVRNPTTGEFEARHINEIASSHLARRTFVGNAYLKAPDPNIIGAMSGHAEGSKAFRRYRNIEESTKRAIIDMMG